MADNTLILFAHPALEKSMANRALVEGVSDLDNVRVHDLYEMYPDFHIDVEAEQALLSDHDRIVWHHPFYWYSTPAILKEWFDQVLQFGWAYGDGGNALSGKIAKSVVTTGGAADAYTPEGYNRYSMQEFLRPIEQTASLCGMVYDSPLVFHQALNWTDDDRQKAIDAYRAWLLEPR